MIPRGLAVALTLCMLPQSAVAATPEDWSDAPAAWVMGLEFTAFCAAGERTFESAGEFVQVTKGRITQPQGISATAAFFAEDHKGAAVWSKDRPRGQDLTTFSIRRDEVPGLRMDGYIGTFPAVARRFKHITRTGLLWRHRSKAATCEDDRAPQIEVDYYVDSWSGGRSVNRVALALASDGALVARFDLYSCWICLFRNKTLRYARFPPATDSPAETPQGPAR